MKNTIQLLLVFMTFLILNCAANNCKYPTSKIDTPQNLQKKSFSIEGRSFYSLSMYPDHPNDSNFLPFVPLIYYGLTNNFQIGIGVPLLQYCFYSNTLCSNGTLKANGTSAAISLSLLSSEIDSRYSYTSYKSDISLKSKIILSDVYWLNCNLMERFYYFNITTKHDAIIAQLSLGQQLTNKLYIKYGLTGTYDAYPHQPQVSFKHLTKPYFSPEATIQAGYHFSNRFSLTYQFNYFIRYFENINYKTNHFNIESSLTYKR